MRTFIEDRKYADRVTHATGYGELHRKLILALDAIGEEVHLPYCPESIRASRFLTPAAKQRLLELNARRCPDDRDTVYLQVATPDSFEPRRDRLNVAITMTERESLEHYQQQFDWVGRCNGMDAILTPTEWNKRIFERHGIRNVRVAALGADSAFFTPRPVTFLSIVVGLGRRGSRTNWKDILDSFRAEFAGQDDVSLSVLSYLERKPFSYSGVGHALRAFPRDLLDSLQDRGRRPEVVVRQGGDLTAEEMRELYRSHDCFVSYSREGWGFPLLEAMCCGLEVIACDYGAPMAYLQGSPALLFRAGRLSADNLEFEDGDLAGLRGHLRSVYERRRHAHSWARGFSWEASARTIAGILHEEHARWSRRR